MVRDDRYHMWFQGWFGTGDGRAAIGYAVAPVGTDTEDEGFGGSSPGGLLLLENYPNPFGDQTIVRFSLSDRTHVSLRVINMLGQHVATLANGRFEPGWHEVNFDATGLPRGVYFVQIDAGSSRNVGKMIRY